MDLRAGWRISSLSTLEDSCMPAQVTCQRGSGLDNIYYNPCQTLSFCILIESSVGQTLFVYLTIFTFRCSSWLGVEMRIITSLTLLRCITQVSADGSWRELNCREQCVAWELSTLTIAFWCLVIFKKSYYNTHKQIKYEKMITLLPLLFK